ncbi:unnamed protein product, partial [Ectocarpus fasciculatus]
MYIGQCKEFHGQAVHKLAAALQEDMVAAPSGLMKVAVWCIGEFADLLASPQDTLPAVEGGSAMCPAQDAMPHEEIIDLLEDLLNHHSATASSRSSALTALAKASYRLGDGLGEDGKARVEEMLEGYRSSITLELQQRSCEYLNLLSPQWDVVKKEALDRMPVMDEEAFRERRARYTMGAGMGTFDDAPVGGDRSPKPQGSSATPATPSPSKNGLPIPSSNSGGGGGDLLDLEDIFGGGGGGGGSAPVAAALPTAAAAAPAAGNGAAQANSGSGVDLLADVFGGGGGLVPSKAAPAANTAAAVAAPAVPAVGGDSDDFGGFEVAPPREDKMV